jgi:Zn/Cd-binding protein ZinT
MTPTPGDDDMSLTPTQQAALDAFARDSQVSGVCIKPWDVKRQTVYALLKRGLIEVSKSTELQWHTEIVNRSFGRGYTTRTVPVSHVEYRIVIQ